jgi:hypothetical protein
VRRRSPPREAYPGPRRETRPERALEGQRPPDSERRSSNPDRG